MSSQFGAVYRGNFPGTLGAVSWKRWRIIPTIILSLLTLRQATFLSAQAKLDPAVKTQSSNWLRTLLNKGAKEISVSPSHPEIKLHLYEDLDPASPRYGVKLCWLELPRSSVRLAVADIRKSGEANNTYSDVAQKQDIVISDAGFFGYGPGNSYLPVGLVIANGKLSNGAAKWSSGGAVVQVNGIPTIVPQNQLPALGAVQEAIQSKPMLVERGRPGIKSDAQPPFNRVSVGLDKNGNLILAGAFKDDGAAVNLVEFSIFLSTPQKLGGPEAVYALNLDGGTDAHLFFPAIGLHMGYGGPNFVPNAIRFYWK